VKNIVNIVMTWSSSDVVSILMTCGAYNLHFSECCSGNLQNVHSKNF